MSQNPFEALGGGGLDLNALFQQAQQMQEQVASAQSRLEEQVVEGTVAGGAVTVKVNGVGELVGIDIKQGEFNGDDPDDLEDLSAVIVAAYRDARSQAEELAAQAMGPLAGGLGGLAGGLGGPSSGDTPPDAPGDTPKLGF